MADNRTEEPFQILEPWRLKTARFLEQTHYENLKTSHRTALPKTKHLGRVSAGQQDRADISLSSILIVEDEVLTSEYLEFVLQGAGYEAIPAASAEEAIAILEHRDDVYLVVTDINLPGSLNGLQLAEGIAGPR